MRGALMCFDFILVSAFVCFLLGEFCVCVLFSSILILVLMSCAFGWGFEFIILGVGFSFVFASALVRFACVFWLCAAFGLGRGHRRPLLRSYPHPGRAKD